MLLIFGALSLHDTHTCTSAEFRSAKYDPESKTRPLLKPGQTSPLGPGQG